MTDITVQDIMDKEYHGTYFEGFRSSFENAVYRDAVQKLEPEDRDVIESIAKRFDHKKPSQKDTIRLGNFGRSSAYELMAKLGIFFNATNYTPKKTS